MDPESSPIVDPQGRPARMDQDDRRCQRCGAAPDQRIRSSGFGEWHDVCGSCGYDFHGERTAV